MQQKLSLKRIFAIFTAGLFLFSCTKNDIYRPGETSDNGRDKHTYENGFFIITEGTLGRNAGTIHFYKYGEDTVRTRVYEKENPGSILSNAAFSSTLQFATNTGGWLYLISDMNGPIVRVNAATLKEESRYVQESSNWRGFAVIDYNNALISAADGVYAVDLKTLAVTYRLQSVPARSSGEIMRSGNYIYVLQDNGAKILSTTNYSLVKSFTGIIHGFVKTPNGKIWASTANRLFSIDSKLDTAGVAVPVSISSWGLDAPTKLTASTKENAVFFTSGKNIYKYVDGQPQSLAQPFINIDINPFMIYGVARYDKNKDYIVVNGIAGYGAASGVNYLLIYNASTGALIKQIKYGSDGTVTDFNHIYFPALTIFQ